jgi:hypothetical protein
MGLTKSKHDPSATHLRVDVQVDPKRGHTVRIPELTSVVSHVRIDNILVSNQIPLRFLVVSMSAPSSSTLWATGMYRPIGTLL